MRLICVDDEELVLEHTVKLCKKIQSVEDVKSFSFADEALSYLENSTADAALLDIDMPDMNGLVLAARIKELQPDIRIVFLTGYSEYAVDAFAMHVSGYLLKPIGLEKLKKELAYVMNDQGHAGNEALEGNVHRLDGKQVNNTPGKDYPEETITSGNTKSKGTKLSQYAAGKNIETLISAQTFGNFNVFKDGKLVHFKRSKSKELLAYLIDRKGQYVTRKDVFYALWEDGDYDRNMQKYLDNIIRSLKGTLNDYGIQDVFQIEKGNMRAVPELIDCDMYRFFDGDVDTINSYRGEYMNDYPWAYLTEGYLTDNA